jgi:hypothetical protein
MHERTFHAGPTAEAAFQLRKITVDFANNGEDVSLPWLFEKERLKELFFAVLTPLEPDRDKALLREIIEDLYDLELLEVSSLSGLWRDPKRPELDSTLVRRILQVLRDKGLGDKEAHRALRVLAETARGLQQHYQGKVQLYLRWYAELILNDLKRVFEFTALSEAEARYALTLFLQNTTAMPISLRDHSIDAFCGKYKLTPEQLFSAADELDINLALVDDVIQWYIKHQESPPKKDTHDKTT